MARRQIRFVPRSWTRRKWVKAEKLSSTSFCLFNLHAVAFIIIPGGRKQQQQPGHEAGGPEEDEAAESTPAADPGLRRRQQKGLIDDDRQQHLRKDHLGRGQVFHLSKFRRIENILRFGHFRRKINDLDLDLVRTHDGFGDDDRNNGHLRHGQEEDHV